MTTCLWVYAVDSNKPSQNESLELSLRMARQNIVGATDFIVIGDRPPELDWVKWINCPRVRGKQNDSVVKLLRACEEPTISKAFLRFYDDHFILKPTTIEELSIARHNGFGNTERKRQTERKPKTKRVPFPMPGRGYHEKKRETFQRISRLTVNPLDYSYHPVIVFEKEKLRDTIDEFDLLKNPGMIESLYLNQWAENPITVSSAFFRNISCVNDWWFPKSLPNVVCVYNKCVGQVLREHLRPYAKSIGVE